MHLRTDQGIFSLVRNSKLQIAKLDMVWIPSSNSNWIGKEEPLDSRPRLYSNLPLRTNEKDSELLTGLVPRALPPDVTLGKRESKSLSTQKCKYTARGYSPESAKAKVGTCEC